MAQARRPVITQTPVNVPSLVRQVQTLREYWQKHVPPEHGNVSLREEDVLIVMLCGFFDPLVRSLRTIEQLAQVPSVKQHLQAAQVPKSTLSDALSRFRVEHLRPLVEQLQKEVPQLHRLDPDLEQVAQKIVAGDGSLFRLAGEVAWALQRRKNGRGQIDSQVRLNLLVDVKRWTMEDFSISADPRLFSKGLQFRNFFDRKLSKLSGMYIQFERTVAYPLDLLHVMPDLFKHAPDLAIPAFDQCDFIPRIGRFTNYSNLSWSRFYPFPAIRWNENAFT